MDMKKGLLNIALILGLTSPGWACKCYVEENIKEQHLAAYAVIFRGTAVKVVKHALSFVITFRIEKLYQGQVQTATIPVTTYTHLSGCAIRPAVGEQWLVYASREEKVYLTHRCTRTVNLNPKDAAHADNQRRIEKDLRFLEDRFKTKARTNG